MNIQKWGSILGDQSQLADSIPEKKEWVSIDLLIGADYYDHIVSGEKQPIGDSFETLPRSSDSCYSSQGDNQSQNGL